MKRGFCYYFREGVRSSCTALFRNKHFFRYLVYFFMELIGRLTLFFGILFDLSNVRQGKILRKQKQVAVSPSFQEAGRKSAWTYFVTVCVEALMFLAGLVLIALLTFALAMVGRAVATLSAELDEQLFMLIFGAPGALIALVYLVIMPIIFAPTPWIVANNAGIAVSDVLTTCFRTMKQRGKITLVLNTLIPFFIKMLCLGVAVGGVFLWGELLAESEFYTLVTIVWILISAAGFAVVAPIFTLTTRVANEHLFSDIVLDPVAANKLATGVNITRCSGQKFETSSIESNLTALFDETDSESQPVLEEIGKTASVSSAPAYNLADAPQTKQRRFGKKRASEPEAVADEQEIEVAEEPAPEVTEEPLTVDQEPVVEIEEPVTEAPVAEVAESEAPEAEEPAVAEAKAEEPAEEPAPVAEPEVTPDPEPVAEPVPEAKPEKKPAKKSEVKPEPAPEVKAEPEEELPTVSGIIAEENYSSDGEESFDDIFGDLVTENPSAEKKTAAKAKAEPKKSAASKALSRLKKK